MFCRVRKQHEEERLQRRVQEEAVKFLWKQVGVKVMNDEYCYVLHTAINTLCVLCLWSSFRCCWSGSRL